MMNRRISRIIPIIEEVVSKINNISEKDESPLSIKVRELYTIAYLDGINLTLNTLGYHLNNEGKVKKGGNI